ncbi:hypothetical protein C0991_001487 [Blastosporella zonata]|nr:hypothetical protein C0991_001487 [Blastosporella zonata]
MIGNRCSNCIQYSLDCTHKEVSKTLGSAKGYVESLEVRLEKMEKLLSKLLPKVDLTQELETIDDLETPSEPSLLPRNDEDILEEELIGKLKRLHVDPPQGRFFGKSSGYQLVQTALDIRSEYVGQTRRARSVMDGQRMQFWYSPAWHPSQDETPPLLNYSYPDDDLLLSLVTIFFEQINTFFPLFHRPSFERSVAERFYLKDPTFGGTLLLVCAIASRYSDDPRVLYAGTTSEHSAGWRYFEQVSVIRKSFIPAPSLSELQNHALSILFLTSSETPQGCWTQLGTALRMAQEVGAHRRRTLKAPTAEDEHWKRAFWVLNSLDRLLSSFSGRQCVLQVDDHDVDLPIECDDEYWDDINPSLSFQQPPDKPSVIAYFNCYIKLMDILAYAMRAIYSVKKPLNGQNVAYLDQQIVMDLDSALNHWMDEVPDHLRWDPTSTNKLFLKQSATLYATYYHLQIFVHRPFIPSFRNKSKTTFPSLAICTNAARSCCHVMEIQSRTTLPVPTLHVTAFISAVVLLLNIWSGKRSGVAPHPQRELHDVQRSLNLLKACERRWCSAGRYRDILLELASAGDMTFVDSPAPATTEATAGVKRSREFDFVTDSSTQFTKPLKETRKVAGSRRVSTDVPPGPISPPPFAQTLNFELPMYGNELGRLPVHGQFNFSESHKRPRGDPMAPSLAGCHPVDPPYGGYTTVNNPDADGPTPHMNSYTIPEWGAYHIPQDTDVPTMPMPVYPDPSGASALGGIPLMDSDTLTMWSTAPAGFEYVTFCYP